MAPAVPDAWLAPLHAQSQAAVLIGRDYQVLAAHHGNAAGRVGAWAVGVFLLRSSPTRW